MLLAQTKIGFLTGGRGYNFQELSPDEKQSQREEVFARATVALTRAQRFCFIMCPLDMKGIIGAATAVGCSMVQECVMSNSLVALFLWNLKPEAQPDRERMRIFSPPSVKTGKFPPAALVEIYHEPGAVAARLRRLHLIVVDLCHPRKTVTKIEKKFHRQITCVRDTRAVGTTPIPLCTNESLEESLCVRIWFG